MAASRRKSAARLGNALGRNIGPRITPTTECAASRRESAAQPRTRITKQLAKHRTPKTRRGNERLKQRMPGGRRLRVDRATTRVERLVPPAQVFLTGLHGLQFCRRHSDGFRRDQAAGPEGSRPATSVFNDGGSATPREGRAVLGGRYHGELFHSVGRLGALPPPGAAWGSDDASTGTPQDNSPRPQEPMAIPGGGDGPRTP